MKVSANLKPENWNRGTRQWLMDIGQSSALLSGIIRVIHPQMFKMGIEAMTKMGSRPDLADVLSLWYSIFNGVQVISNREAPVHRDHSTRWEWYDLLATVGPYDTTFFALPGVGIRFLYGSGTVIGICGRVLRHGVSEADGERISLAYYMRENVQRRLETRYAGWNNWDSYRN